MLPLDFTEKHVHHHQAAEEQLKLGKLDAATIFVKVSRRTVSMVSILGGIVSLISKWASQSKIRLTQSNPSRERRLYVEVSGCNPISQSNPSIEPQADIFQPICSFSPLPRSSIESTQEVERVVAREGRPELQEKVNHSDQLTLVICCIWVFPKIGAFPPKSFICT